MEAKIMSEVGVLISTILKLAIGKKSHHPDHECDKYFHYLQGRVEMFKFPTRNTLGIHIPESEGVEGHIFVIHEHLKNVLIGLGTGHPYPPDVVITFHVKKNGTIMPLLSGEGSRRINILKFDHKLEEMVFKLLGEIPRVVSEYNLQKLKASRKKKK